MSKKINRNIAAARADAVRLASQMGLKLPDGFSIGADGVPAMSPTAAAEGDPIYMLLLINLMKLEEIARSARMLRTTMIVAAILVVIGVLI